MQQAYTIADNSGGDKGGYWGYLSPPPRILGVNTPPGILGVITPPQNLGGNYPLTYIQALNSRGYSTCCLYKVQLP